MHRTIILRLLCLMPGIVSGTPDALADDVYQDRIRPLLRERCFACHGSLKQEAGLRLDTGAAIRTGSDGGPIIDLQSPEDSTLIDRLVSGNADYRMPPIGKPLTSEEIADIREWIVAGAHSPVDEKPEPSPSEHWSFHKPIRPPVPDSGEWAANTIDHFIADARETAGLSHAKDAPPAVLLRRVTLDLTGIPPTLQQLQQFLSDPSPERYDRVVDRLLDSPHYGERWGRHWMDVWRYSDWYGRRDQNDVRNSAPQIWRWRDWIVDSLNSDKSYARMIQEMLAADEIAADDDSTWPATGYLIRSYYSLNPNEWMRHNVEYTGKAFLGLTFNCAHCHDHKYDPIEHDDYFRFRAFFEPMGIRQDRVVGQPEPPLFERYVYAGSRKVVRTGMVRIYDEKPEAPTWFYTGGDERNRLKDRGSVPPGVPSFLNVPLPDITPVQLPQPGWYPGSRPNLQQTLLKEHTAEVESARQDLKSVRAEKIDTKPLERDAQDAQLKFDQALSAAIAAGEQGALSGKQSLLMDVPSGRRIIQRPLDEMKSLSEGTTINFLLHILQDGHFNFQLAKDASNSLTALYFAFESGQIKAYRPGGFMEFSVGSYDSDNPHPVRCRLTIQPSSDTATLLIQPVDTSQSALVDNVSIALNGWNPTANPHQPITLDCHAGSRVLIDDLTVTGRSDSSQAPQSWSWDFEAPKFGDGENIVGMAGWGAHQLSSGPGICAPSSVAGCQSAQTQWQVLQSARRVLRQATRRVHTAALRLKAAESATSALKAVIAADSNPELAQTAYAAQLQADEDQALWQIEDVSQQLSDLQKTTKSEQPNVAQSKKLNQKLVAARTSLQAAGRQKMESPVSTEYRRLSPITSQQSTGRRSALAAWITHPNNPLTPRVAVNHIWMRHFHRPLVDSVYDFGRNGNEPSHPKLLDWLAVEFQENDWSMKHLHRLIVTSQAYQMHSSAIDAPDCHTADPENRLLWRMNTGRMESEVIRDSILAVSQQLDDTLGGEVLPNTTAMTSFRRSLYYETYPEGGGYEPLGAEFDAPDPGECFRRTATVVPQQALALSNSEIVHRAAAAVVELIEESGAEGHDAFVNVAFRRVLNRPPTSAEARASIRFLESVDGSEVDTTQRAFVRALFNHNDFVSIR